MTDTLKATSAFKFNAKSKEAVKTSVESEVALAGASVSKDTAHKALGKIIDQKTGANVPIFPTLKANGKWETYQQNQTGSFTHVEWLRGMAFMELVMDSIKAQITDDSTVDAKTVLLNIKRNCKYWEGTRKSSDAVSRARKDDLKNPEGKVSKPNASGSSDAGESLTSTQSLHESLNKAIGLINTIVDEQGTAGLDAKKSKSDSDQAIKLIQNLQALYPLEA